MVVASLLILYAQTRLEVLIAVTIVPDSDVAVKYIALHVSPLSASGIRSKQIFVR